MTTDELSTLGNCWIGSDEIERQPTSPMARLTTTASTGWRMNRSVIARMAVSLAERDRGSVARDRRRGGDGDQRGLVELERTRRGDLLAGREAAEHDDLVAEHGAALHV